MVELRALNADECDLLVTATLGNINWCGERFSREDVLARPEFAHYTRLEPGRGDVGVVAVEGEAVIGVAWAQYLPASGPGFGFVDDRTPESSFWVAPEARGRGVGRALVRSLLGALADAGAERVSLSVEAENVRAKQLYLSEGFVDVPGREADGVMLRELP